MLHRLALAGGADIARAPKTLARGARSPNGAARRAGHASNHHDSPKLSIFVGFRRTASRQARHPCNHGAPLVFRIICLRSAAAPCPKSAPPARKAARNATAAISVSVSDLFPASATPSKRRTKDIHPLNLSDGSHQALAKSPNSDCGRSYGPDQDHGPPPAPPVHSGSGTAERPIVPTPRLRSITAGRDRHVCHWRALPRKA
ncbi:hypothetical protein SAMN04488103_1132 [Gemmobacter aquatilis]|uniref:Uncharacterized protein n=1 Tax=Gemmobacter aquatilis TaxID=933059 RepID=A0A1H8MBW1_9RHOB|nr:hypothetical protein SAMN04488103_1132 [Gemmobacter aquatilis]